MNCSVPKLFRIYQVVLVASLVVAVGCGGDGSTGLTGDYTLALSPASLTIIRGYTGSVTVNIARTQFVDAVSLSLVNGPVGVAGSFDAATPTAASSILTVSVATAVPPGTYNLMVAGAATVGNRSTPLSLTVTSSRTSVTTVKAGFLHSCALSASGQAFCWGENNNGRLGTNSTETCVDPRDGSSRPCSTRPVAVTDLTFADVSGIWGHTCGVTPSGVAYCWGWNVFGQIGDGTTADFFSGRAPTPVAGSLTFGSVSAGYGHTCGATTSRAAYCWGGNPNGQIYGQLGDGTTTQRLVPTAVAGSLAFVAVSAGFFHTCGVTTSGAAYCWGSNFGGALGDGTTTHRLAPTPVAGALTFAALSAGFGRTCGVTMSGAAYCWGYNSSGQVGDGTTTDRLVPTPVTGGLTFATVSAGDAHTCGVTTSGAGYCWGNNFYGELGVGSNAGPEQCVLPTATTACSRTPVAVAGGHSFAVVSVGSSEIGAHTCGVTTSGVTTSGVTTSGAAYCWGDNHYGQLGDGTTTRRLVPTLVAFP